MSHRSLLFSSVIFLSIAFSLVASAAAEVKLLPRPSYHSSWSQGQVNELVAQVADVENLREVRVQIFRDHMVLQLFKLGYHRVDFVRVDLTPEHAVLSVRSPYAYSNEELTEQNERTAVACPDPSVQFIAFAPNDDATEQGVTQDVIQTAQAKGYKVVSLLKAQATRLNYLSYMSCPQLVGNFYDGDSNPQSFITVDGVISSAEISANKGLFRHHVTNIWVACEAYNDPMLSAVTVDAQAQKYAAGINDLLVGPSDNAAACAMKASLEGSPMTQAFQDCYKQVDTADDHWGFGGTGSDLFAH